ncbi:hypothetical protein H6P81_010638 [Aristolochia fimbriata]|uniref:Uncharacterized protein n=1 Tax=Aristolochia fimbriata TaxID=158543 RepID=A0AAV7EPK4_ARIFI|nr:hypothetical protein H6P81_010638 [Aristolochia fimbriata]
MKGDERDGASGRTARQSGLAPGSSLLARRKKKGVLDSGRRREQQKSAEGLMSDEMTASSYPTGGDVSRLMVSTRPCALKSVISIKGATGAEPLGRWRFVRDARVPTGNVVGTRGGPLDGAVEGPRGPEGFSLHWKMGRRD